MLPPTNVTRFPQFYRGVCNWNIEINFPPPLSQNVGLHRSIVVEAEYDNIAVLTVIEGGKGDRSRREMKKFSTEDVRRRPLPSQCVLGNRPGLDYVVAGAQAKPVVGRVERHRSYLANVGRLYNEGLFKDLGPRVQRREIQAKLLHLTPSFSRQE